jgi:queuine/archaeosine tRNA-ribosyltransferase
MEADMPDYTDHQIKINRATRLADVGRYPSTCSAMMRHLPAELFKRATAAEIAMAMHALWAACRESKSIAIRDAIDEGAIWDARQQRMREIA